MNTVTNKGVFSWGLPGKHTAARPYDKYESFYNLESFVFHTESSGASIETTPLSNVWVQRSRLEIISLLPNYPTKACELSF